MMNVFKVSCVSLAIFGQAVSLQIKVTFPPAFERHLMVKSTIEDNVNSSLNPKFSS